MSDLDMFRTKFQSKGFSTKTFFDYIEKQWNLEIIEKHSKEFVVTLFFDNKSESLLSIK